MNRALRSFIAVASVGMAAAVVAPALNAQQTTKKSGDPLKQAAREYSFEIRPTIGVVFPVDPDGLDTGWDLGASFRATPPNWDVGLQLDLIYLDLNSGVFQATAEVFYEFSDNDDAFRPYIIGGLGIYDGNFGLNAGLGVDFAVVNSPVGFFLESRFHRVFDDPTDVSFIPINAGVRIRF